MMNQPPSRRGVLRGIGSAVAAPMIVPSRLLGADAPSNRLRIGLIGTGGMCWGNASNIHHHGGGDIVALCDVNRPNMTRYQQAYKVPAERCFQDFRELLSLKDIDAVIIATPDHWHVPISIAAAKAGKHVYCQKPLSNTIAEGRALVKTIHQTGVVFQHGTQLRSLTANRLACEIVRNGYIGRVSKVVIGSPPGLAIGDVPPDPVPDTLDWDMYLGPVGPMDYRQVIPGPIPGKGLHGWYFIKRFSLAGWIAGYGVHDIDLALWGLGLEHTGPVRIEGRGTFPKSGLFNTVLDYELTFTFTDGRQILMTDTSKNRHGVKFMHENGKDWVFCRSSIEASDRQLLQVEFKDSDVRLYQSQLHEKNFTDCIRKQTTDTITPIDVAHRSTSVCLLGGICLELGGAPLQWDPSAERFINNDAANALLDYEHRAPWKI